MRRLHLIAVFISFWAVPAQAHVAAAPGSQAWHEWRPDIWIVAAILLTLGLYLLGLVRLWRASAMGRGIGTGRAACFVAGGLILLVALASPLERLAGALLTAHMVQHVIVIAVAPPLIVLGRAEVAFAWAMPRATRRGLVRHTFVRGIARLLHPLVRPLPATLLHGAAVWIWHAPGLFQAALANSLLHDLEHASFFVTALAFWYGTLLAVRSPTAIMAAMVCMVITLIHGGLLGALITLTPSVLYPIYAGSTGAFGLTSLEDQQLAGLIMWVPASAIYLLACLYLAACLLDVTGQHSQRKPAAMPAAGHKLTGAPGRIR